MTGCPDAREAAWKPASQQRTWRGIAYSSDESDPEARPFNACLSQLSSLPRPTRDGSSAIDHDHCAIQTKHIDQAYRFGSRYPQDPCHAMLGKYPNIETRMPSISQLTQIAGREPRHHSIHFILIASMNSSFLSSPTPATTSFIASTSTMPFPCANSQSSPLSYLT